MQARVPGGSRPGIFLMDEAHEATGYLVVGRERACVIDTMNGYNNLYQAVIVFKKHAGFFIKNQEKRKNHPASGIAHDAAL